MNFKWVRWNIEHIAEHGIDVEEAESVVIGAARPYPEYLGDERFLVRGQIGTGLYLQVIFIRDPDTGFIFIIHARPLTAAEKRQLRRRRR